MSYFRENVERMAGYVPGEQPSAERKVIKLNTNENPYPPSPKAMDVLHNLDGERLRRYSDPMASIVREAAGEVLDVPAEWILAGNGSDDLLTMLFRAIAGPGRKVVCPSPTYTLYHTLAGIQEAPYEEVPFSEGWSLPVDALAAAGGALTLVANPNSPSGTFVEPADLEALANGLDGILVVDEAYADFARDNAVKLPERCANVVVLRTLSKGYSLAGLRLGFGIARPEVVNQLVKVKDSYNVDAVACAVGAAALADQAYHAECTRKVITGREKLSAELERLGFTFPPSESNFLLARPPGGDAGRLYEALKDQGILVRWFDRPGLAENVRITVGTAAENGALIRALEQQVRGPRSEVRGNGLR